MVSSTPKDDSLLPPAQVSAAGTYTLKDVRVGCKLYATRPHGAAGGTEERLAEVLSIRHKPIPGAPPPPGTPGANVDTDPDGTEYFVHWHLFNKRLDEWIVASRFVLGKDMEWPRPKVDPAAAAAAAAAAATAAASGVASGTTTPSQTGSGKPGALGLTAALKRLPQTPMSKGAAGRNNMSLLKKATIASALQFPDSPSGIGTKRKAHPDDDALDDSVSGSPDGGDTMDLDDEDDVVAVPLDPSAAPVFLGKESEIEKLRHSGSMTQSAAEIARVKNLNRIQMGRHEVEAWYFSPYPTEYAHLPVLFLCEFCLSYFPSQFMLGRHRKNCTLLHPPGNEVYRDSDGPGEEISFFEIDGRRQVTWCRNLSLLSKCFLDHKTLYYDVQPFLYYIMTVNDDHGCHIIGYFSKEKESAENYNVACILTLPQHQRKGYGKLLIEFSYELSRRENKLGSPEKPLSDLGLLSYKAYWMEIIIELLLRHPKDDISIEEIATTTSITQNDVMWTCQQMGLFKHYKNQHVICIPDHAREQYNRAKSKNRRQIKSNHVSWKPPVFSREQLRFGY